MGVVTSYPEWEGVSADLTDEIGYDPPVDAFVVAACCGLQVEAWSRKGAVLDRERATIRVNTAERSTRVHMSIAHEIGHWAQVRAGLADEEEGARWIGGAILLPRRAMLADLRRTSWSIDALRELHSNASAEAIAIRIVQLRDAVATVIDNGRVKRRVASPWLADPRLGRISRWERELAAEALRRGAEVRGDELCYALPLVEGAHERVIVIAEAEQLSLRLGR
jgi:Zn-dependent peptidase ImmA (M78 family)